MHKVADIKPRLLMGPGPSDVNPRVLQAMAHPTIGHLDPQFLEILNDVRDMLQQVFHTKNRLTLAVSGTGSAGMEAAVVNTDRARRRDARLHRRRLRPAHGGRGGPRGSARQHRERAVG